MSKRKSMIIRLMNEFDETVELLEALRDTFLDAIEELEKIE